MPRRTSAKGAARTARAEDARARKAAKGAARAADSFQSFGLKLGIGTGNALSSATYGFNPISRNRVLLEWIHRGSWLGGAAADLIADDMTRAGVDFLTTLPPEDEEKIRQTETRIGLWSAVRDGIMTARIYGGSIVVPLLDGQDFATPLRLEAVGKGQLKGFLALDRWMVDPSLEDLVAAPGPHFGDPKFYTVTSQAPGLRGARIHHSRCMRLLGIKLPYWQAVMENLWGISVYERLYDRMVAFDSATQGAAQLVYKSYIRTYAVDQMREAIGLGGAAEAGLVKFVEFMTKYQGIEGLTLIDAKDRFETHQFSGMSGVSDALLQFGQQISGALQIPLVRLFGQSPAGLNSSGESDLRTYYDGINAQQNTWLKRPMRDFYLLIARSEGVPLPDSFDFKFTPLWQMTEPQRAEVAGRDTDSVVKAHEAGIIGQATALRELRESARATGRFSNISNEDIEAAESAPPPGEAAIEGVGASEFPELPRRSDDPAVFAGLEPPDGERVASP